MSSDQLVRDLTAALEAIPLIDPHSHIDPYHPTSTSLDHILGYHYYTELAHSAGMGQAPLSNAVAPRERVRAILSYMDRFDNTAQYSWFVEIARSFLGFQGDRVTAADADALFDAAEKQFNAPDWEQQVFAKTNLEKIFLTNEFDDTLEGFDTSRYVPCLRTDSLVFHFDQTPVRDRLAKATGIQVDDLGSMKLALRRLFEHFVAHQAKACAISLPPDFEPFCVEHGELDRLIRHPGIEARDRKLRSAGIFWLLAENCREFHLPFDLMIGVNRRVYRNGVFQGQDLFDQRTSLLQYADLFNAFPEVTFPISVLTSVQNQELVSYAWIFPNVVTNGHWWYSNIPTYIMNDVRGRLQAVPKTKQIGYYSDAYKLEFVLPKFGMYRRLLARVLADDFVRTGMMTETQAVATGKYLLRDNVREIFSI